MSTSDPEPFIHPTHGRATIPHTGIGWKWEPRDGAEKEWTGWDEPVYTLRSTQPPHNTIRGGGSYFTPSLQSWLDAGWEVQGVEG